MSELSDEQLLRYSRHILLPEIGDEGQQKLLDSVVLIVGLGGLGSPAALYLAAAGIGKLIIADGDKVELSNLQRQIVHTSNTIGMKKTDSAVSMLGQINPLVSTIPVGKLMGAELTEQVSQADVVIDASDNFETRYAINKACRKLAKPLVSGAVIRMEGQVSVFMQRPQDPCYECLYPNNNTELNESCVQTGILAPVAGIVGSIQATEALKIIIGFGRTLAGKLLLIDAKNLEWREIELQRNEQCPICSGE